jgi:MoaA/NifB/PqqE/SkfB family radical SAM enzyme
LARAIAEKVETVTLNGGEPTLVEYLPEAIRELSRTGLRTVLFTNGRSLSSLDYCRKLLYNSRNLEIQIPIHGPNGEVHDSLTRRAGSFREAISGVLNLLSVKNDDLSVVVKTVICKGNASCIHQTAEMVTELFPSINRFVVSSLIYQGKVLRHFDNCHVSIMHTGIAFDDALEVCKHANIPVVLEKIPACALREGAFLNTINASQTKRRIEMGRTMIYFDATTLRTFPMGMMIETHPNGVLPEECAECKYYDNCPGFQETYFGEYVTRITEGSS